MNEKPSENTDQDISGEVITAKRKLSDRMEKVIYWFGILTSLFHLWVTTIGILPEIQRNAIHFGLILFMGFIMYPLSKKKALKTIRLDVFLAILSVVVAFYLVFFEDALHARNEQPLTVDLIFAAVAIVLMIEITRRTSGYLIPTLATFFPPETDPPLADNFSNIRKVTGPPRLWATITVSSSNSALPKINSACSIIFGSSVFGISGAKTE